MDDTNDKAGRAGPRLDVRPACLRGFAVGCWLAGCLLGFAAVRESSCLLLAASWMAHAAASACIAGLHHLNARS